MSTAIQYQPKERIVLDLICTNKEDKGTYGTQLQFNNPSTGEKFEYNGRLHQGLVERFTKGQRVTAKATYKFFHDGIHHIKSLVLVEG